MLSIVSFNSQKDLSYFISKSDYFSSRGFCGFYANLFSVPKLNSDVHHIFNLKRLNMFLWVQKFEIELVQSVVSSLQQEDFLASVHIKYAYRHIAIFPPHQRFLLFTVGGHYFQFVALLFGLSMAHRVFTKVLALVLGLLHTQYIPIIGYLDDLILRA